MRSSKLTQLKGLKSGNNLDFSDDLRTPSTSGGAGSATLMAALLNNNYALLLISPLLKAD